MAASAKAAKFSYLQLRSVIDDPAAGEGAGMDECWGRLLRGGRVLKHAEPCVDIALPTSEEAEDAFLSAVVWLADALASEEALARFYRRFGWSSPEAYFSEFGETQVMFVDTDHNDMDDRLAIVLLAFQMASANLERRRAAPESTCALYLDCRNYEGQGALTVFRTLRLVANLRRDLASAGLFVDAVLSDSVAAASLVAGYLGCAASVEELDKRVPGVGSALASARERQPCPSALLKLWPSGSRVTLWIMSGLSGPQVADITAGAAAESGPHFVVVEQAQPAWQSTEVAKDAETQPAWEMPPLGEGGGAAFAQTLQAVEFGFGAEPSNIRSGEAAYPQILDAYLDLQQAVASKPELFDYRCPALARDDGYLPVPPGQRMPKISGRPLTVLPGPTYEVKKALNATRAAGAFHKLLRAAQASRPSTLYQELIQGPLDDDGRERKAIAHIVKYGTFMSDAILVALGARPPAAVRFGAFVRRLAVCSFTAALSADDGIIVEAEGAKPICSPVMCCLSAHARS